MDWFIGSVVFLLVWWTVLFAVLPWGNRTSDTPEEGHFGGAPINPRLKKKFIATTVISILIWMIIYICIEVDIISFYDMAHTIPME